VPALAADLVSRNMSATENSAQIGCGNAAERRRRAWMGFHRGRRIARGGMMDGMSSDISACVIGTQIRLLTPLLVKKMGWDMRHVRT